MANQLQGKVESSEISAQEVIAFLRANPDFFSEHDYLLKELKLPHASGNTISLVQRQLSLFREERDHYHNQLIELIDTARENGHYFENSRKLLMSLLDARSISEVDNALKASFANDFEVDFYSLVLLGAKEDIDRGQCVVVSREELELALTEGMLGARKAWCGQLNQAQSELIFGRQAGQVKSSALVPVGNEKILGLLSIGSKDPEYFHSHLDSVFLTYISESLGKLLPALMTNEAGSQDSTQA